MTKRSVRAHALEELKAGLKEEAKESPNARDFAAGTVFWVWMLAEYAYQVAIKKDKIGLQAIGAALHAAGQEPALGLAMELLKTMWKPEDAGLDQMVEEIFESYWDPDNMNRIQDRFQEARMGRVADMR